MQSTVRLWLWHLLRDLKPVSYDPSLQSVVRIFIGERIFGEERERKEPLVDSGSDFNIIARDLLPDNHQQLRPSNYYLRGAHDVITKPLGEIDVKITWYRNVYNVNFTVLENSKKNILGTPWIIQSGVRISPPKENGANLVFNALYL